MSKRSSTKPKSKDSKKEQKPSIPISFPLQPKLPDNTKGLSLEHIVSKQYWIVLTLLLRLKRTLLEFVYVEKEVTAEHYELPEEFKKLEEMFLEDVERYAGYFYSAQTKMKALIDQIIDQNKAIARILQEPLIKNERNDLSDRVLQEYNEIRMLLSQYKDFLYKAVDRYDALIGERRQHLIGVVLPRKKEELTKRKKVIADILEEKGSPVEKALIDLRWQLMMSNSQKDYIIQIGKEEIHLFKELKGYLTLLSHRFQGQAKKKEAAKELMRKELMREDFFLKLYIFLMKEDPLNFKQDPVFVDVAQLNQGDFLAKGYLGELARDVQLVNMENVSNEGVDYERKKNVLDQFQQRQADAKVIAVVPTDGAIVIRHINIAIHKLLLFEEAFKIVSIRRPTPDENLLEICGFLKKFIKALSDRADELNKEEEGILDEIKSLEELEKEKTQNLTPERVLGIKTFIAGLETSFSKLRLPCTNILDQKNVTDVPRAVKLGLTAAVAGGNAGDFYGSLDQLLALSSGGSKMFVQMQQMQQIPEILKQMPKRVWDRISYKENPAVKTEDILTALVRVYGNSDSVDGAPVAPALNMIVNQWLREAERLDAELRKQHTLLGQEKQKKLAIELKPKSIHELIQQWNQQEVFDLPMPKKAASGGVLPKPKDPLTPFGRLYETVGELGNEEQYRVLLRDLKDLKDSNKTADDKSISNLQKDSLIFHQRIFENLGRIHQLFEEKYPRQKKIIEYKNWIDKWKELYGFSLGLQNKESDQDSKILQAQVKTRLKSLISFEQDPPSALLEEEFYSFIRGLEKKVLQYLELVHTEKNKEKTHIKALGDLLEFVGFGRNVIILSEGPDFNKESIIVEGIFRQLKKRNREILIKLGLTTDQKEEKKKEEPGSTRFLGSLLAVRSQSDQERERKEVEQAELFADNVSQSIQGIEFELLNFLGIIFTHERFKDLRAKKQLATYISSELATCSLTQKRLKLRKIVSEQMLEAKIEINNRQAVIRGKLPLPNEKILNNLYAVTKRLDGFIYLVEVALTSQAEAMDSATALIKKVEERIQELLKQKKEISGRIKTLIEDVSPGFLLSPLPQAGEFKEAPMLRTFFKTEEGELAPVVEYVRILLHSHAPKQIQFFQLLESGKLLAPESQEQKAREMGQSENTESLQIEPESLHQIMDENYGCYFEPLPGPEASDSIISLLKQELHLIGLLSKSVEPPKTERILTQLTEFKEFKNTQEEDGRILPLLEELIQFSLEDFRLVWFNLSDIQQQNFYLKMKPAAQTALRQLSEKAPDRTRLINMLILAKMPFFKLQRSQERVINSYFCNFARAGLDFYSACFIMLKHVHFLDNVTMGQIQKLKKREIIAGFGHTDIFIYGLKEESEDSAQIDPLPKEEYTIQNPVEVMCLLESGGRYYPLISTWWLARRADEHLNELVTALEKTKAAPSPVSSSAGVRGAFSPSGSASSPVLGAKSPSLFQGLSSGVAAARRLLARKGSAEDKRDAGNERRVSIVDGNGSSQPILAASSPPLSNGGSSEPQNGGLFSPSRRPSREESNNPPSKSDPKDSAPENGPVKLEMD